MWGVMKSWNPFAWELADYERRGWWWLLAAGLLVLLPGTWSMPLLDRDEPRFASATIEMMERGSWAIPYFNGDYRFDKPPLIYWWMMPHYWLLGKSELAARLPAIEASLLVALGIFALGRRLLDARAGFWAGFAFLTCVQVWIHGRLAVADMPMVLAVVLTHWASWELIGRKRTEGAADGSASASAGSEPEDAGRFGRWWWLLWLGHSFGFYAKGPIVLFCWVLTLSLFWLLNKRRPLPWGRLGVWSGLALFTVLLAMWGIPALLLTDGAFWEIGMGKHVVERGLDPFNDRLSLPFFYFLTAFISLLPWISRLPLGIRQVREKWDRETAYLLAWAAGPYIIFSFYATQLPHYTLPAFPALLLLLFRNAGERADNRSFFWLYHGLLMLLLTGLAGTILWVNWPEGTENILPALLSLLALLAAYPALSLAFESRRGWALVLSLLMIAVGSWSVGRSFRAISPVVQLAEEVFPRQPGGILRGAEGFTEPSLVWYAGDTWAMAPEEGLGKWLAQARPGEARMALRLHREWPLERFLKPALPALPDDPLSPFKPRRQMPLLEAPEGAGRTLIQGMNFARFGWTEIEVIEFSGKD